MKKFEKKIWLASPTMHGDELKWVTDAFEKTGSQRPVLLFLKPVDFD